MTYFLNMHGGTVFFLTLFSFLAVLGLCFGIAVLLGRRWNLSDGTMKILMVTSVVLSILFGLFGTSRILNRFNQGGIDDLFFLKGETGTRLSVLLTRIYPMKVGATYDRRLSVFSLDTGTPLGSTELTRRGSTDEYRLFRTAGDRAWGYSRKAGLQLLDLAAPALLAGQKEILERNPQLGGSIRLYAGEHVHDPYTNSIYVRNGDGSLFLVREDLKAVAVDRAPASPVESTTYSFSLAPDGSSVQVEETRASSPGYRPPPPGPDFEGWDPGEAWDTYGVKDNLGVHVHRKGAPCSPESALLLEPEFIREFNTEILRKDRVWVVHKSALFGDYDPLLSLVTADGVEVTRLNLQNVFRKEKKPTVLGTWTRDGNVLIFVTVGSSHRATVEGFALTALKADRTTGEMLGRIDYF